MLYKAAFLDLLRIFQVDAKVGLIGLTGCKALSDNGIWWGPRSGAALRASGGGGWIFPSYAV